MFQGKKVRISLAGKVIYHATECTINIDSQTESIATKDTDGNISLPDGYSWTASTNALVAVVSSGSAATHTGAIDVVALQLAQSEVDFEFTTGETGDFVFSGKAYVTSSSITATVGSTVKGSFTFTGNGNLTKSVVE